MKKFKIEFYCDEKFENCLPEPYPSYKHIPKWFADLPTIKRSKCPFQFMGNENLVKDTSVKGCPSILDYLTYGYTIPAWTNFLVREVNGELLVNWENSEIVVANKFHTKNEYESMNDNQLPLYDIFCKLFSPWYIKTSPGVSCLLMHPYWEREDRFTTVSGIYHSDVTPLCVPWFFEWNYKLSPDNIDYNLQTIKKGTPLIYIFPFQRSKFESKIIYTFSNKIDNFKKQTDCRNQDWFNQSVYNSFRKSFGKLFF